MQVEVDGPPGLGVLAELGAREALELGEGLAEHVVEVEVDLHAA